MPEPWRSPFASNPAIRTRMSRQRRRDTAPEVALRRALHAAGLRYYIHRRPLGGVRREADVVFPRHRVAVFVDGCFWHRCPQDGVMPRRNHDYWSAKLSRNVTRDRETDRAFADAGWRVVRVWEHEDPTDAAARVIDLVRGDHG